MSDIATAYLGTVDPQSGMVMQPDRRMVRFETVPTQNMVKSREMGRPVYDPVTVLFVPPGESGTKPPSPWEHQKYGSPRQWAAFEAGAKVDPGGTPLAVLFLAGRTSSRIFAGCTSSRWRCWPRWQRKGLRRIGMGAAASM